MSEGAVLRIGELMKPIDSRVAFAAATQRSTACVPGCGVWSRVYVMFGRSHPRISSRCTPSAAKTASTAATYLSEKVAAVI